MRLARASTHIIEAVQADGVALFDAAGAQAGDQLSDGGLGGAVGVVVGGVCGVEVDGGVAVGNLGVVFEVPGGDVGGGDVEVFFGEEGHVGGLCASFLLLCCALARDTKHRHRRFSR